MFEDLGSIGVSSGHSEVDSSLSFLRDIPGSLVVLSGPGKTIILTEVKNNSTCFCKSSRSSKMLQYGALRRTCSFAVSNTDLSTLSFVDAQKIIDTNNSETIEWVIKARILESWSKSIMSEVATELIRLK